jgi:hypothetical protein
LHFQAEIQKYQNNEHSVLLCTCASDRSLSSWDNGLLGEWLFGRFLGRTGFPLQFRKWVAALMRKQLMVDPM